MPVSPITHPAEFASASVKRGTIGRAALLLFPVLLLSVVYWDKPELLLTSDSLAPTDFIWDLLHHADAWAGFQQPHSPGFFPDEVVLGIVQAATGSWRVSIAAWVFVALAGLVTVASKIAADLSRCHYETAGLAVLLVGLPLMTAAVLGVHDMSRTDNQGLFFAWLLTFLPGGHGGNLLLCLTAGVVANRAAKQVRAPDILILTFLCFAGWVSDQLTLIGLLAPVTAALLIGAALGTIKSENTIRVLAAIWIGVAVGASCTLLIDRQFMPHPSMESALEHGGRFLAELSQHLDVVAAAAILTFGLVAHAVRHGVRSWLGSFWPVFAAVSSLGSLAFTIMFYEDVWSFRYALPLLWWAIVFLAASLANAGAWFRPMSRAGVLAIGLTLMLIVASAGYRVPRLFVWDTPLASCLRHAGLRAGLAEYWVARKTSIESDWDVQIGTLDAFGGARVWGNDSLWFTHDIHDASQRPRYRFIVTDRLPVERLTAAYGEPDRVMLCDGHTVWIFNDLERVFGDLARASPYLDWLFAAAPPR